MSKGWLALVLSLLVVITLMSSPTAAAQSSQQATVKPYHEGPVWDMAFIRVKAGMEDRYMRYLADEWKREQESQKKAGYILDYKVIATEPHGAQDYDVVLMTEYKDLATMETNADKMEDLALQMFGGMPKVESGYEQRAGYREVIANRLGREIVLEPKAKMSASK